jgi:hypothetical protein
VPLGEGLFVANPSGAPWSGWVDLIATCLRGDYKSVEDAETGARIPLRLEPGLGPWVRPRGPEDLSVENVAATFADRAPGRLARFWVEGLPAGAIRRFRLSAESAAPDAPPVPGRPGAEPAPADAPQAPGRPAAAPDVQVSLGDDGWPESATWPGMEGPLFGRGTGDFVSVSIRGFAPRWVRADIWAIGDDAARDRARRENLVFARAVAEGKAEAVETPHTIAFTQRLGHPRLLWATRTLELRRREPRARLTVKIDRISSDAPEIFFVSSRVPGGGKLPVLSCGGVPFTPFEDQIPGCCRDYFAVDGWALYRGEEPGDGSRVWASRDAPLLSLGDPSVLARTTDPPGDRDAILSRVYDNFWYTNFVGNSPGAMEFRYDFAWRPGRLSPQEAATIAESLAAEPVVCINPALPESPLFLERLYRP